MTKNIAIVILINCLAWTNILRMDNTFWIKKKHTQLMWSWSGHDFAMASSGMENQWTSGGMTGPSFLDHSHRPMIHLCLWPSWGNLILVVVWIKSLATAAWSFCSGSRSHRLNFATTHFMPRSCIKTSDTVVLGIPWSASSSCTVSHRSLLIAACTCSTLSGVLLVAGLPEHGSPSADSRSSLKRLCHTLFALHSLHHPSKPSESSE